MEIQPYRAFHTLIHLPFPGLPYVKSHKELPVREGLKDQRETRGFRSQSLLPAHHLALGAGGEEARTSGHPLKGSQDKTTARFTSHGHHLTMMLFQCTFDCSHWAPVPW